MSRFIMVHCVRSLRASSTTMRRLNA